MIYQDSETNKLFAECEYCKAQSELLHEDIRISTFMLAEQYGWWTTENGELTCCTEEHWVLAKCQEQMDQDDIDNIEEILKHYGRRFN